MEYYGGDMEETVEDYGGVYGVDYGGDHRSQ